MRDDLLEAGAPLWYKDSDGRTAVIYARDMGKWTYVEKIINSKATDQNDTYGYGEILISAIQLGKSLDLIKKLIAQGACNKHATAVRILNEALRLDKTEIANLILASVPVLTYHAPSSSLHWAADKNLCKPLQYLLDKGADQTLEDADGKTPLEVAVELDHWEAAQLLLNHRKDKKVSGEHDEAVFITAIQKGHYATVKLMLEQGASVARWDAKLGYVALHWAVKNNEKNPKIVTLLMEFGAGNLDLKQKNEAGQNIFEFAKAQGHTACLAALTAGTVDVKSAVTSEDLRSKAARLYQEMREDSFKPEEMPAAIKHFEDASLSLLQRDLESLKQRREKLQGELPTLIDAAASACRIECEKLTSMITTFNQLLRKPRNSFYFKMPVGENSVEAQDLNEFFTRKQILRAFEKHVRNVMTNLEQEIHATPFKKKSLLGWRDGMPTHIIHIKAQVESAKEANTTEEMFAKFVDVMNTFKKLDSEQRIHAATTHDSRSEKFIIVFKERHPDTILFDSKWLTILNAISFANVEKMEITATPSCEFALAHPQEAVAAMESKIAAANYPVVSEDVSIAINHNATVELARLEAIDQKRREEALLAEQLRVEQVKAEQAKADALQAAEQLKAEQAAAEKIRLQQIFENAKKAVEQEKKDEAEASKIVLPDAPVKIARSVSESDMYHQPAKAKVAATESVAEPKKKQAVML